MLSRSLAIPVAVCSCISSCAQPATLRKRKASPQEMEEEIVIEQEDTLKNVEGLRRMKSRSEDSKGTVELEFPVGTDIDSALLRVSNKLNQVPEYPAEAERPVIISSSEKIRPIAWMHIE